MRGAVGPPLSGNVLHHCHYLIDTKIVEEQLIHNVVEA